MAEIFGLPWEQARPLLLLLIASHDIGKACPGFQMKWDGFRKLQPGIGLRVPISVDTNINHAFVTQICLSELLQSETRWAEEFAHLAADAVGSHHGERCGPARLERLGGNRRALGGDDWSEVRRSIFHDLLDCFKVGHSPSKEKINGPGFMLLAGLTSFADWIGSNEMWFGFGIPKDCLDLPVWWDRRREIADKALDSIGWFPRRALVGIYKSFEDIFRFSPRPLQKAVEESVRRMDAPCVILIEAPMGEGKTEAAFHAYLELQRRLGHRGLYVALPTRATGNAMFDRTLKFLRSLCPGRYLDCQLLHGGVFLNESFQNIRISGICGNEREGEVRASEWFTHKKRALLSEYGVGTVDQALLPILPVRHNFVRLWGLANRVVIFDEIHAYDAYTGTLLEHLIHWLLALGSSVILLSATLPPEFRRRISELAGAELPEHESAYPRLTVFGSGKATQSHFEADESRHLSVTLEATSHEIDEIGSVLCERLKDSEGAALALMNTVGRAQDLYKRFPEGEPLLRDGSRVGKRLRDGTDIFLFHARFPAVLRKKREDEVLDVFGKEGQRRRGRKILIATQVAEQSLDLDFDMVLTDLAPIDLVLQRAGRLWRHARGKRPLDTPCLLVSGLIGEEPPSFGKPLWWGKVYREDILLRTWCLLKPLATIVLPDEIDGLVRAVYEEEITVPDSLVARMEDTLQCTGELIAKRNQAHRAIIGLPDDASWNDPGKYIKADEDEPGLHPSLIAQTRSGEPSVIAVPIFAEDGFSASELPDAEKARTWFLRCMSVSRKGVVTKLAAEGVPEGWRKSPLLRNCYPLLLDTEHRWGKDAGVFLDDELGLVYGTKEAT
jgi:CRISPR-associated endonuclease/helicase Cas3